MTLGFHMFLCWIYEIQVEFISNPKYGEVWSAWWRGIEREIFVIRRVIRRITITERPPIQPPNAWEVFAVVRAPRAIALVAAWWVRWANRMHRSRRERVAVAGMAS